MTAERGKGKRNGFVRSIWLHIAKEGGRWTAAELAPVLNANPQDTNRALHNMAARQKSLTKVLVGRRPKFGVTKDCMVPQGVTLKDLAELGMGS